MGIFDKFLHRKRAETDRSQEQAVFVNLDGNNLPKEVYEQFDLDGLDEELAASLDGTSLGELDGHELSPTGATFYLYGPDAEKIFARIEPILRGYPLCERAVVVIRSGKPGSPERTLTL